MADEGASAMSGGLLVILGIMVAVGLIYFVFMNGGDAPKVDGPDVSISVPKE